MKTVEERMQEICRKAALAQGGKTCWEQLDQEVEKQLTQQAVEWQIALKEAVQVEHDAWSDLVDELKAEEARLRSDNSVIGMDRQQLKKEVYRLDVERGELRAENQRLKAVLSQFQSGERGETLDRTISRLDEVEAKLKRLARIFLDDDRARL